MNHLESASSTTAPLTVVIPHHRGEHLALCLRALAAQTDLRFETLVVLDGCPTPPDLAALHGSDRPPGLRAVASLPKEPTRALGFTAAANVGLREVRTPFVLLLNDDVFLDPVFVAEGLAVLARRPDAAAVAGVLVQERRPDRLDNLGIAYEPPGHAIRIGYNRPTGELIEEGFQRWLYGPSAAAGLYRTDRLRQVAWPGGGVRSGAPGIFDERLEAYYDDVDLVLRLVCAHAATWFCPRMVGRHVGHATYGRLSSELVRLSARNSRLVYNTFLPPAQRLAGLPYRLPFSAAQGMLRLVQGRGLSFLRGKFDPRYRALLNARRAEWRVLGDRLRKSAQPAAAAAPAAPGPAGVGATDSVASAP
ncbi:MAG: glycosyltransferase [Planctomycetota bacterium]